MASITSDPVALIDDVESLSAAPSAQLQRAKRVKLIIPLLPWTWFLIRDVHPVLEYVAIGLPIITIVAALGAAAIGVFTRGWVWAATVGSLVVFFALTVFGPWRPIHGPVPRSDQSVRVASANLGLYWFSDNDAGYFVERQQPDVMVGTELTESHDAEFRRRFEHAVGDILLLERQQRDADNPQPTSQNYRAFGLPSLGVYSKYPIEVLDDPLADRFDGGLPGLRVRLDAPGGPMIVYALHIPKPSPSSGPYQLSAGEHVRLVKLIAESVESERDPVIVVGDLNSIDRSHAYRTMTENLNDGMRYSSWAVPTTDRGVPWSLLFARIDHLLISDSLCASDGFSEDTRFSDHRPIVANVGPCETN